MSLKEHLYNHLKKNEGKWVKKVQLYVLADELGYSPESVGRDLRYLEEDEKSGVERGYYDGKYAKGLVKYSYKPLPEVKPKLVEIIKDGIPIMMYA